MINANITGIASYTPDYVLTNDELSQMVETSDEWITTRVGIKERRILKEPHAGSSYMGVRALNKLLEETGTSAEDIELIICATSNPDYRFPSTASIIAYQCGAKNAYAYDITVATAEGKATVNYRLNAPASAVMVQLWNGSELVKEVEGTTIAEYGDYEMTTVNNLNTVVMDIADVTAPGNYSYKVKVSSDVVSAPTAVGPVYRFWSPYGIAVDNNPDSPYFGRVLVTETQTSLPDKTYHSAPSLGGIGIGIYAFDQMLQPIENAQGTHGFTAGMEMSTGKYPNGTSAIYDPKRIHISDDGRIFLSRVTTNASSLWEINPDDLNAPATEIFKGTLGTEGYVTDAEGNFVAGPATAMDVWGEGENLKVAIVSCKDGYALDPKAHRVDVYNLGTAKEWSSKPSQELASISNKYWINSRPYNCCRWCRYGMEC